MSRIGKWVKWMTMARRLAYVLAAAASFTLAVSGSAGSAVAARATATTEPAGANYPAVPGRLYHVAANSPRNAWAVGLNPRGSLIEHWNGQSWSQSFNGNGFLYGVSAVSARDAWAVGGTNWFSPSRTLIEHWNGSDWTFVPSPSPGGSAYLTAVKATSARNA
jgi:hypothetical protein